MVTTPPPSELTPHHLALKVRDLDLSERFYSEVLGLKVVSRKSDEHGLPRSVWLDASGMILMLELGNSPEKLKPSGINPGWHLMAFSIPRAEREHWKKRLNESGAAITQESPFSLYFRDPEGNLLALSHYPDC